jgi:hypothetical protein
MVKIIVEAKVGERGPSTASFVAHALAEAGVVVDVEDAVEVGDVHDLRDQAKTAAMAADRIRGTRVTLEYKQLPREDDVEI